MSKIHITRFTVEFGDCDPAEIVFYPNYLRWMDAASLHFFRAMGVPPWRELEAQTGIIGTPIVDVAARFRAPCHLWRRDRGRNDDLPNGAARASCSRISSGAATTCWSRARRCASSRGGIRTIRTRIQAVAAPEAFRSAVRMTTRAKWQGLHNASWVPARRTLR